MFKVYTWSKRNNINWDITEFDSWIKVLEFTKGKKEAKVVEIDSKGNLLATYI